MHIAICDDNIADRKQLERLLGRESEKRKADTGVFYTDSYGRSESLRKNPMQYDLFFIDLTLEEPDGLTFALQLTQMGVTAPIVLCSSKINYLTEMQDLSLTSTNLIHLDKPVKTDELSLVLNKAVALQANHIPTIELRSEKQTRYVLQDEIIYAVGDERYSSVYLSDGSRIEILTDLLNFYDQVASYSHMVLLTEHAMINITYMCKYTLFKVTLKDGTEVKSSPLAVKYIKSAVQLLENETGGSPTV